jgi:hypothetical protein
MSEAASFRDALHGIGSRIDVDMSEKDIENAFLNEEFYTQLGYEGAGHDLRSEMTLPDNRRPDYITLDDNESVTAVYEFKTSGEELSGHEDQLFHYVETLKAEYGVLTNGEEFRLYRRDDGSRMLTFSLAEATESHANDVRSALRKPAWDIRDPESVTEYLDGLDAVGLDGELGREHFFDTFRLEDGSPFADLVTAMMDLLGELRDERDAAFVTGAYDFWEASYANVPDEVPKSWEGFVDGTDSLRDFMFALESGHALLARLLLAKATEDHDFFPTDRGLERYFDELGGGFSGTIDLDAYPIAANGMIEEMRNQLVESLFEDDIFIWWTEGYGEQTASQHADQFSRFRDVAREGSDVTTVSPATRERFSRAIARVAFAVLKFDFSRVAGDPLGDLYQRYFDPETRKALGEFYTPQPVIDYIMDGVGYEKGVSSERIIDPSCGSGTFLVEAVNRYLDDVRRYDDDPDWAAELTELCSHPHIVGLDVHPFAVLMAQIRFMVTILPEYKQAKRGDDDFTIRRLPIFRTDTLRNERELTGVDLGDDGQTQMTLDAVTEDNQDVRIPVPLPIEVDDDVPDAEREGDFLVQRVRMPLFETVQLNADVRNFGEYFAALQGVLDVVKWHMSQGRWEYGGGLAEGINRYTSREYEGVEEFFAPYVDDILDTVRYLKEEHGDGRLFKMFEDTVLALVVKNYMEYDYVVGNPPYVRVQNLPDTQKEYLNRLYDSTEGNYDIYCTFYERGLEFLKEDTGKLGYITSNQFLLSDYGEGIRRVLLDEAAIEEIYDFRDSGVFEDAANLPVILFARDEADEDARQENEIRCVRVKSNIGEHSQNKLDREIVESVREHNDNPGYTDDFIDVFDFPQAKLDDQFWSLMPPAELGVFEKMEANQDGNIESITDSVFAGTQTSANGVYVVIPRNADYIGSDETGDIIEVSPTGDETEVFEIESDLLRPWLQGIDVQRWRGDWSGQHVILPYYVDETEDGEAARPYSAEHLQENLPLTWDYFQHYRDTLEGRENGKMVGRDDWFSFIYPKNHERFEKPKIINADMASNARYMIDEDGEWYFKTPYGLQLIEKYRHLTKEIACQLNSNALDFYLKHIAPMLLGGKYRYQARYISQLPCRADTEGGGGVREATR